MNHIEKSDVPTGSRKHGASYRWFGLLAAFFLATSCTFVPLGKTEVSRAARADFGAFQGVNAAAGIYAATQRTGANTVAPLQGGTYRTTIIPLDDGEAALYARLGMIDRARHTLDISAFIIRRDNAGFLFADRLIKAADRGVKVRLLLDDLFNHWTAGNFLALDHHPNIDMRIFNPFSRFSPTAVDFLLDYNRVSRRMHSRMIVADNSEAILGGRNIGDEYFSDNGHSSFTDFEVLARGRIARQFSASFEMYWSDQWSLPIPLVSPWDFSLQYRRLMKEIAAGCKAAREVKYPDLVDANLALDARNDPPRFDASAEFVTDVPDKLRQGPTAGPFIVAASFFDALKQAKREVLIITPYFIPEESGAQMLQRLAARGVRVTIVTNSLASTNHVPVHGGYAAYRDRLIRSGVVFHELDPEPRIGREKTRIQTTLHSKFAIIDGSQTIVTTMNFDPVSIRGNLETSIVVHGRPFADWMLRRVNPVSLENTYRLSLDDGGAVVWRPNAGAGSPETIAEPGANIMRRVISGFSQVMKLDSML